jgi:3-oxoacyl-[acyl-carrier-protein] synthase III
MSDIAAVALLEAGSGKGEILGVQVRNDGALHQDYWCEYPASRFREGTTLPGRNRLPHDKALAGLHYPSADLDALRALALERIPEVFGEVLARTGLSGVDATLVTHLDARVEAEIAARLGARAGHVVTSSFLYAGGASLPALVAQAKVQGSVKIGETIALVTSGSGASWGCGIVRVA